MHGSELWVISFAAGIFLADQLEYLSGLPCREVNCGLLPLQLGFPLWISLNVFVWFAMQGSELWVVSLADHIPRHEELCAEL